MTNEEARQWFLKVYSEIKGQGYADENEEAYELAIKALEQDKCKHNCEECEHNDGECCRILFERSFEQEPCEDAVSRHDVLKILDEYAGLFEKPREAEIPIDYMVDEVMDLPSVQPSRKGHWIHREDMDYLDENGVTNTHLMCEDCGFIHNFKDNHTAQYNFCPNCGADMRGAE